MNCTNCGSALQPGAKFCSGCGAPAAAGFCASCGSQLTPGAAFCASCGKAVAAAGASYNAAQSRPAAAAPAPTGATATEAAIMDTGAFPIAYVKNVMSSINGKLTLTGNYLVFKASHLQGVGGVAVSGMFIPNPADAKKSQEHFSLPLAAITAVEKGWSHITVTVNGQKYKFGGMTKTAEWEQAINNARGAR